MSLAQIYMASSWDRRQRRTACSDAVLEFNHVVLDNCSLLVYSLPLHSARATGLGADWLHESPARPAGRNGPARHRRRGERLIEDGSPTRASGQSRPVGKGAIVAPLACNRNGAQEKTKTLVRQAARVLVVWLQSLWEVFNCVVYFRPRPPDVWLAMLPRFSELRCDEAVVGLLPMLPRFSVLRCDEAVVGLLPSSGRSRCHGWQSS